MKHTIIFYIALPLLLSMAWPGMAQTEKLRFERVSVEQGSASNPILCMLQDSKGYLWFGTSDGLIKYDGYTFTTYKHSPQDTNSLIQNLIFSLWEDNEGILWVGTAESGISKFDRYTGKFTWFRPPPDSGTFVPPLRAVSAFNEDKEGYLWVGNYGGELRRFDRKTGKFSTEKFTLGFRTKNTGYDAIYCIFKDREGNLWVGNTTGLHRLNLVPGKANQPSQVKFTHYQHDPRNPNSLSHNFVSSIYEDHTGMLWIGTGGWGESVGRGLNRFDPKRGVFTHYQHDPRSTHSISSNSISIKAITEDTAGNLWVGTNNGLNKLNQQRKEFIRYLHDPNDPASLNNNIISSLLIDKSGIVWVGTSWGGLNKLDPNQKPFRLYHHDPADVNSLSNNVVISILAGKKGMIWIGTDGGGLNALDKKTGKFTHYRHIPTDPNSLASDQVRSVLEDRDGNLWASSGKVLSRLNPETGKFVHYPRDFPHLSSLGEDYIYFIIEDPQGLLWLGTGNGIKSFDPKTEKIVHYRHDPKNPKGLADHATRSLYADTRGNIWVGHGSVGLSKLNKTTGIITQYLPDPTDSTSLSTSLVNSIYEDSKGNLWLGTQGGGLCRFDYATETFVTYSQKQGLPDNTIDALLEDTEGNLWMPTAKGLSKFSPTTQTFTNYDAGDRFQSSNFYAASLRDQDGTLYFGGLQGLTAFDPKLIKPNPHIPPIVITGFRLFDKVLLGKNEAEEIILNYDENFFSFEFSALNFTNSSKNQYAHQLVGVDKDWVDSGTRRLASYTNIGPGEYIFRVKGSNNDGVWNKQGTAIKVIIHPPFWRTWWAYSFYGLCFLAGVFAVDRIQRRRLIEKERQKAREKELTQAREIEKAYHELQSTQAQLIQKEKMASLGELTAGIAHEIQNPLNFVNNFSEVSTELVAELKEEIGADHKEDALAIADDLTQNLEKIHHHGRRADSIVKSMLQHSRASSGEKQLTDLNKLADEYMRLSYHGMRAKDKEFNASLVTDFDASLAKVEVIPQELGRVLLNLFNNAFYATQEKHKVAQNGYLPEVKVSTRKLADKIEICVRDNGTGIPATVKQKIFQPFFTTKPAGEGTGLGLSLSYDIVTKGHGGVLEVESKEGEFTEFVVMLPKS